MNKTTILLIAMLLLTAWRACATGVGVVPDKLIFGGEEERFRILNPNEDILQFSVSSEKIDCEPEKGEIAPLEEAEIACTATTDSAGKTQILVETALLDEESVSVMPAVAISAEIMGEEEQETTKNTGTPLEIQGEIEKKEENQVQATTKTLTPEIITIIILAAAIIVVLAYSEIKKRKPISNAESNKGPEQETSQSTHQENGPPGCG
jgi:hypothetical protein